MIKRPSKTAVSTAALVLTALIWGMAFTAQIAGMDYMGALTFNGVRFALGALSLVPIMLIFERRAAFEVKQTVKWGLLAGVVLFSAGSLQQLGIQFTLSAGKAGFITGLYIVLVPIIGVFMGKKAGINTWIGAVFAFFGLYMLSSPDWGFNPEIGDILLIACSLFWALHIIVLDRAADRVDPIRFSITQYVVCSALSMGCAFAFEDISFAGILAGYAPLIYGGVASVGIAYTLQIFGQRHVPPARAAIIFSLESLFAAVGGALLLGEQLTPKNYFGCAAIFAGILLSVLNPRRGGDANG